MGMDVYVYSLDGARVPKENEEADTHTFYLLGSQRDWFQERIPGLVCRPHEYINTEKLYQDLGVGPEWCMSNWNFEMEQAEIVFETEEGATQTHYVPAAAYICRSEFFIAELIADEVGYMRKPFRKATGPLATVSDDGSLVLSSDNFKGNDSEVIALIMGPAICDNAQGTFTPADRSALEALKAYCAEPALWQEQVLDNMADNCVTVVSW